MNNTVKYISIKNHTHYFSDDIINIKDFDPDNIKPDEKSWKNILIYCSAYVTIRDWKYVKINSLNPFYLTFKKIDWYFEECNGNKYLTLFPTNESKE